MAYYGDARRLQGFIGTTLYVPFYFCWYVYNLRIYATVHGIYYSIILLILLATGNLIHNVPLKLVRTIIAIWRVHSISGSIDSSNSECVLGIRSQHW